MHRLLREVGLTCDVVHPSADLGGYAVIIVPTLYLVSDADAAAISAAAADGAQVLITYISGLVDEHDHVRLGDYPGAFSELLGVRVEEFDPLMPGRQVALSQGHGTRWSEFATATDAQVRLRYAEGPLSGRPALTRRAVGSGAAWYAGTRFDEDTWRSVLDELLRAGSVAAAAQVPSGVEAVRRRAADRSWLFLLNHFGESASVPARGHDLLTGTDIGSQVVLPPGGCEVIREG